MCLIHSQIVGEDIRSPYCKFTPEKLFQREGVYCEAMMQKLKNSPGCSYEKKNLGNGTFVRTDWLDRLVREINEIKSKSPETLWEKILAS